MDVESKLDEDFLFYLSFCSTFYYAINDEELRRRCKIWLNKLCSETYDNVKRKRSRNIYLVHLIISMQNKELHNAFLQNPSDVDIENALDIFDTIPDDVEPPAWLNDSNIEEPAERPAAEATNRTYFATRTLPNGQGAFAYIGLSLTGEEPMWLGGGEGRSLDEHLARKYQEHVPPEYEMEKILARRKDPKEREKVLAFYDVLLQSIVDELDGIKIEGSETIEGLILQLTHDLRKQGLYEPYEAMGEEERRNEFLLILHDRVKARRDKIAKREELLDNIEDKVMPPSFFEASGEIEDKYQFPAAMWEQAINKLPTKKHVESLLVTYPLMIIEDYTKRLSDFKEEIAIRMQRRHENIVSQMKKEMRKDGEKKREAFEKAEIACLRATEVLKAVRKRNKEIEEIEKTNRGQGAFEPTEHTKAYEALKAAVYDTQRLIEEEAEMGKFLANQISAVHNQTEQIMQVNEDMVEKTEASNMKIMRNIKRLKGAIKQFEKRLELMKSVCAESSKPDQSFFM